MPKIMIIEDDPAVREELAFLLKNEGYAPLPVTDFDAAPELVREHAPDLVLLDLCLPGRDGFALCAAIRGHSAVPIIFVTARDSRLDELRALSLGGDDYITKPYDVPLLLARIKAVLRRSGGGREPELLTAGDLRLDLVKGMASAQDRTAELTKNELHILACLMSRAGAVVPRADLIEALWDHQVYIDDNTLSVNMTRLRAKLDGLGLRGFIKTRRGMGYQL